MLLSGKTRIVIIELEPDRPFDTILSFFIAFLNLFPVLMNENRCLGLYCHDIEQLEENRKPEEIATQPVTM